MRTVPLLALLCSLLLLAGCASGKAVLVSADSPYREPASLEKGQILHLRTGRLLTEAELFDYAARFPVVYVGEDHENVSDHEVQLAILKALEERFPGKVAVGLEMLQGPSQPKVDDYVQGKMEEKEFLRVWQEDWGNNFPYYREILRFARERKIRVLALNAGKKLKEDVRRFGIGNLPPETARQLPEMDLDDPYHTAFLDGMLGGHAMGTKDPSVFRSIQVLWDETMAQTGADFLKSPDGQGKRLLVFAGGNHVRYGFGIPRRLFRRLPVPYLIVEPYVNRARFSLPQEKLMEVEVPVLPMPSADVYWSVDYRDLSGQRVMLGVQIAEHDKQGVKIVGVLPGSPASRAGVLKDDVVVAIDGTEVKEAFDLTYQVGLHKPGDEGTVEVLRGSERISLPFTYDVVKHGE